MEPYLPVWSGGMAFVLKGITFIQVELAAGFCMPGNTKVCCELCVMFLDEEVIGM